MLYISYIKYIILKTTGKRDKSKTCGFSKKPGIFLKVRIQKDYLTIPHNKD